MKVALIGYGKMGKAIEEVINETNENAERPVQEVVKKIDNEDFTADDLREADVAIEFTKPQSAYDNVMKCFEAGIPVVSGTTGWMNRIEEAKKLCEKEGQTLFYASNFSIGVNIFFEINNRLARLMNQQPQYDLSIHEVHHTEKLDAPSGTAITLAEGILKNMERKQKWVNKAPENEKDLPVLSYREKDVPGIHIVNYESEFDSLEIKHTAHSRKGFATGAVKAAEWVIGKKGFFGMRDMLKLEE